VSCGDGKCNGSETCESCPGDCGACPATCGDGQCAGGETCKTCPGDCGACPATCGDGACNGAETCVNCAADCGACECTPQKSETSDVGCQPCQKKQRSCGADGKWGQWGACASTCTGTQLCVSGKCATCNPGSTEHQNCPCGTQTRTCDQSGAWGAWGTCATACTAGFTCLAGGRCGKQYTAYSGAGGPECGSQWNGSSYTYFYCVGGDYCENAASKLCRTYQNWQPGDLYHSYAGAGGPECGSKWNGSYYTYFYCKGGDACHNAASMQCSYSGTACDAVYTSYASAGGPECGSKWNGSYYTYFYCKSGDYCNNAASMQCKVVTSCPAGAIYHAYAGAGGPQCGSKWNGSSYTYYYCKPGDLCYNAASRQCKK
jgi:hypothetical protein